MYPSEVLMLHWPREGEKTGTFGNNVWIRAGFARFASDAPARGMSQGQGGPEAAMVLSSTSELAIWQYRYRRARISWRNDGGVD